MGVGVLAVAGFMIYRALNDSLVYFILPSEYAADPDNYREKRIRLGGIVEEESVVFDNQNLLLTFKVSDSAVSYPVAHTGTPPELFKEGTGVVIEGSFEDAVFVSDNLLIKHTEVYEAGDGPVDNTALKKALQ